jgi:hypothetical protein
MNSSSSARSSSFPSSVTEFLSSFALLSVVSIIDRRNVEGSDGVVCPTISPTKLRKSIALLIRSRWSPSGPFSCEMTNWLMVTTSVVPVMFAPIIVENIVSMVSACAISDFNGG